MKMAIWHITTHFVVGGSLTRKLEHRQLIISAHRTDRLRKPQRDRDNGEARETKRTR